MGERKKQVHAKFCEANFAGLLAGFPAAVLTKTYVKCDFLILTKCVGMVAVGLFAILREDRTTRSHVLEIANQSASEQLPLSLEDYNNW